MQQSKDKSEAGLTAEENEMVQDLVAETRLAQAIRRHQAMTSPSTSKPSPTSTGKKPNE
jgi:hypothetical protein